MVESAFPRADSMSHDVQRPERVADLPQKQCRKPNFLKIMADHGWRFVRVSGSHFLHVKAGCRSIPVVVHGGKVDPLVALKILQQAIPDEDGTDSGLHPEMRARVNRSAHRDPAVNENRNHDDLPAATRKDVLRKRRRELRDHLRHAARVEEEHRELLRAAAEKRQFEEMLQHKRESDIDFGRAKISEMEELIRDGRYDEAMGEFEGAKFKGVMKRFSNIENDANFLIAAAWMEKALGFTGTSEEGQGGEPQSSAARSDARILHLGSTNQRVAIQHAFDVAAKLTLVRSSRMALEEIFLERYLESIVNTLGSRQAGRRQEQAAVHAGEKGHHARLAEHKEEADRLRAAVKLIICLLESTSNTLTAERIFHKTVQTADSSSWSGAVITFAEGFVECVRHLMTFPAGLALCDIACLPAAETTSANNRDGGDLLKDSGNPSCERAVLAHSDFSNFSSLIERAKLDVGFLDSVHAYLSKLPIFRIIGARETIAARHAEAACKFFRLVDDELAPWCVEMQARLFSNPSASGSDTHDQGEDGGPTYAIFGRHDAELADSKHHWRSIILQYLTECMAFKDIQKIETSFITSKLAAADITNALQQLQEFNYHEYIEKRYALTTFDLAVGCFPFACCCSEASTHSLRGWPPLLCREVWSDAEVAEMEKEKQSRKEEVKLGLALLAMWKCFTAQSDSDRNKAAKSALQQWHFENQFEVDAATTELSAFSFSHSAAEEEARIASPVSAGGGGVGRKENDAVPCGERPTDSNDGQATLGLAREQAICLRKDSTSGVHQRCVDERKGCQQRNYFFKHEAGNRIAALADGIYLVKQIHGVWRILCNDLPLAGCVSVTTRAADLFGQTSTTQGSSPSYSEEEAMLWDKMDWSKLTDATLPRDKVLSVFDMLLTAFRGFSRRRQNSLHVADVLAGDRSSWLWPFFHAFMASSPFFTVRKTATVVPRPNLEQMGLVELLADSRDRRHDCDQLFLCNMEFLLYVDSLLDRKHLLNTGLYFSFWMALTRFVPEAYELLSYELQVPTCGRLHEVRAWLDESEATSGLSAPHQPSLELPRLECRHAADRAESSALQLQFRTTSNDFVQLLCSLSELFKFVRAVNFFEGKEDVADSASYLGPRENSVLSDEDHFQELHQDGKLFAHAVKEARKVFFPGQEGVLQEIEGSRRDLNGEPAKISVIFPDSSRMRVWLRNEGKEIDLKNRKKFKPLTLSLAAVQDKVLETFEHDPSSYVRYSSCEVDYIKELKATCWTQGRWVLPDVLFGNSENPGMMSAFWAAMWESCLAPLSFITREAVTTLHETGFHKLCEEVFFILLPSDETTSLERPRLQNLLKLLRIFFTRAPFFIVREVLKKLQAGKLKLVKGIKNEHSSKTIVQYRIQKSQAELTCLIDDLERGSEELCSSARRLIDAFPAQDSLPGHLRRRCVKEWTREEKLQHLFPYFARTDGSLRFVITERDWLSKLMHSALSLARLSHEFMVFADRIFDLPGCGVAESLAVVQEQHLAEEAAAYDTLPSSLSPKLHLLLAVPPKPNKKKAALLSTTTMMLEKLAESFKISREVL